VLYITSGGILTLFISSSGNSYSAGYDISSALDGNWHFVGLSCNLNMGPGAKIQSCTLDGVTVTPSSITDSSPAFAVDWQLGTDFVVGDLQPGGEPYTGDLAEFYFNVGSYRDMTNPTQVAHWYDAGQPADLGSDGSNAGAGIPEAYLSVRTPSGVAADFLTNRGSQGNFTVKNGALTLSATNP
jgi:hypothetical protein